MAKTPNISDAEWEVMQVVWDGHPTTAGDVASQLQHKGWSERTVKTLLGRLVRKGALGFEEDGKRYRYHPRVSREAMVRSESRSFIERVLGGRVSPLLAQIVRDQRLTGEELAELRALLDQAEDR